MAAPAKQAEYNHAAGHRERLRDKFRAAGPGALHDYELLELLLFRAIPRRDVKPLAKRLMAEFGGLGGVLAAEAALLQKTAGVSENVATELKIVAAAAESLMRGAIRDRPVLSSWTALLDYCRATMSYGRIEEFRVFFLDNKNRLIADEVLQRGTINHAPVYPREVVKRALEVGAAAIILAHNHPSGDCTPSKADIAMTQSIVEAAKALGVAVHDHLIIGAGEHASFKSLGLL
ncbi:MAG: DNA repair protein RadC [Pseudomonadota bacterium]